MTGAANGRTRLVLAEDSVLLRKGLAMLLDQEGFEVVAEASDADELLRKLSAYQPDVAVVDIRMPPTQSDEGLRAAEEIGRRYPGIGVVVLSQYLESGFAMRLLQSGTPGRGYLLKDSVTDVDALADMLRRVARGECVVDPAIGTQLMARKRANSPLDELSDREREILALMAQGRSNHGVAERLVLSERTVEAHVRRIFRKLDLATTADDHRRVLAVLAYLHAE